MNFMKLQQMCSNDMIIAHIETFINMLETKHLDLDMHIISLEITHRENVTNIQLCRHYGILLQWMYMSMSLVINILLKEMYPRICSKDNPNKLNKFHPHIMIWKGALRLLSSPRWH
jgi:hypothetical protein